MKLSNGTIIIFIKSVTPDTGINLKSLLIFNYVITVFTSIYFIVIHLFKKKKTGLNIFFILMIFFLLAEFSLIAAVHIHPALSDAFFIPGLILFFPAAASITLLSVFILFPAETISRFTVIIGLLLLCIIFNFISIFFTHYAFITISQSFEINRNLKSLIQSGIVLFLMIAAPAPLFLNTRIAPFRRIKISVVYYVSGLFMSYIILLSIYFAGIYYYHIPALGNPFIPLPLILMMIITNHLIYDIKKTDFLKLYKILFIYLLAFSIFFIPVYFFLKYYSTFSQLKYNSIYIKSGVIFIYLSISYRLINPYIEKIRSNKFQTLLHEINKTLMPVDEMKKISDMDNFWKYITNDNFQNLKTTLGIQSAYFMLINRSDNTYQFTYGYGPELNFQSIDIKSEIADFFTSHTGIFEISFLIAENSIKSVNKEVLKFFKDYRIELSMVFKNMSEHIIGFLLLGELEGKKSYSSDHLAALEIFRIKIQNLLITDMIIDEVTSEQVAEHDKIVVSTVKNRIIPSELASIPGIRISSLNMDNSSYGGDYFDSVKISSDKTIIFIAETSYSGIDSALIGMELFSILHSRTLIFNSPEKILNTMNQVIKTSRLTNSFARCSCVIVSSDGNFSYANASHNQLLIFDPESNSFTEIETENIPLGIEMEHRYSFTTGRLKERAMGILYSDGLFSSCNDQGETFPSDLLRDTIIKFSRETPSVITRELYTTYKSFIGTKEQLSDVTVVLFKRMPFENDQH